MKGSSCCWRPVCKLCHCQQDINVWSLCNCCRVQAQSLPAQLLALQIPASASSGPWNVCLHFQLFNYSPQPLKSLSTKLLSDRWLRPTLDVVGIYGGFQGNGIKTIVPSKATAKISCRLVPEQNPDDIIQVGHFCHD